MNISLSFVEYDAVNGLRNLSPTAFTLISTAKLGQSDVGRLWVVDGTPEAFALLREDLASAKNRFLRASIAIALGSIVTYIDQACAAAARAADAGVAKVIPALLATSVAPAS